jgi:hypothetical protein
MQILRHVHDGRMTEFQAAFGRDLSDRRTVVTRGTRSVPCDAAPEYRRPRVAGLFRRTAK